jgi:hypothetical protein
VKEEQESDTVGAVRRLARRALVLAIARYVAERPAAQPLARSWLDEDELPLLAAPARELAEDADEGLAELAQVEARLRRDEELWQTRRVDVVNARLTLQAARSGTFGTAVGMFRDFLRDAGEEPQTLDIH